MLQRKIYRIIKFYFTLKLYHNNVKEPEWLRVAQLVWLLIEDTKTHDFKKTTSTSEMDLMNFNPIWAIKLCSKNP